MNVDFENDCNNVISLDEYRKRIIPTSDEIKTRLCSVIMDATDLCEVEVAEALLEMYESGQLDVRRTGDGVFVYSLQAKGERDE